MGFSLARLRPGRSSPAASAPQPSPEERPEVGEELPPEPDPHDPTRTHRDRLGLYAKIYPRDENEATRHHRTSRVLFTCLCLSMAVNLGLCGVVIQLIPLQRVVPYLVQAREGRELIARVQPFTRHVAAEEALLGATVARYVSERHELVPNQREIRVRWFSPRSFVANHSSRAVYAAFAAEARVLLESFTQAPFAREVEIVDVRIGDKQGYLWYVTFSTSEYQVDVTGQALEGAAAHARRWLATITIVPRRYRGEEPLSYADVLRNPLGVVVTEYSVSSVELREGSSS